jgi:hypothetical protein
MSKHLRVAKYSAWNFEQNFVDLDQCEFRLLRPCTIGTDEHVDITIEEYIIANEFEVARIVGRGGTIERNIGR